MRPNLLTQIAIAATTLAFVGADAVAAVSPQQAPTSQTTTLKKAEMDGLIHMREEEKLALDVYTVLSKKWGSRPFGNIAQAEQTHMNAVKALLDKYGLPDPNANLKPGQFKDKNLQKLHDELVKSGSTSRVAALMVGAKIEDLDIYDLARMSKLTTRPDLLSTYEMLSAGSRNHLRAFVRNLRNSGATYKPQYISQTEFDRIISSSNERGRGGG